MLRFRVFEYDGWFSFHVYAEDENIAIRMLRRTWGENVKFEIIKRK